MPKESEVFPLSEELSLTELIELKGQGKRIKTAEGIKTAKELLSAVREVLEEIFHNPPGSDAEQKVEKLPKFLHTAVRKCILAARKSKPVNNLNDDKELAEWIEIVEGEKIHWL